MSRSAGLNVGFSANGHWRPGGNSSASHGFTLSKGGLVANAAYEYCLADAAHEPQTLRRRPREGILIGSIEGVAQPRQRLTYCFLGGRQTTPSASVASGAGAMGHGSHSAFDRSYATVMRQWSPRGLAAAPRPTSHSFTLTKAGLVTIRYEYSVADPRFGALPSGRRP